MKDSIDIDCKSNHTHKVRIYYSICTIHTSLCTFVFCFNKNTEAEADWQLVARRCSEVQPWLWPFVIMWRKKSRRGWHCLNDLDGIKFWVTAWTIEFHVGNPVFGYTHVCSPIDFQDVGSIGQKREIWPNWEGRGVASTAKRIGDHPT